MYNHLLNNYIMCNLGCECNFSIKITNNLQVAKSYLVQQLNDGIWSIQDYPCHTQCGWAVLENELQIALF